MKIKKKYLSHLDVFRGIAALSVCAVHFNYNSIFHNYFSNGLFVQLFFTLSGFVIAYNYYETITNITELKKFIIKRFKRLYPLHLFFLLLFFLLELFKYILDVHYNFNLNIQPFEINSIKNFILNIFFVQHFANEFNFNGPSWSISVEFFLYSIFGISILFIRKLVLIISIIYIIVFIIFFKKFYGESLSITAFSSGLYSFLIGYFVYFIFNKRKFFELKWYLEILFYIFFIILILEILIFNLITEKYIYSLFFGLIIYFSCYLNKNFFLYKFFFNRFFNFVGKISYSIYLSHFFIFIIFDLTLKNVFNLPAIKSDKGNLVLALTETQANLYTLLLYLLTITISYFTYKFIEMHFYKK